MPLEELTIIKLGDALVFEQVHRAGNMLKNTGRVAFVYRNARTDQGIRPRFVMGGPPATFGLTADVNGETAVANGGENFHTILDVSRFNDPVDEAIVVFEYADGTALPDDDASGHPDDVEVAVIEVIPPVA